MLHHLPHLASKIDLSGNVYNLIKREISTELHVLLLVSVSWWFPEGFDDRAEADGTTSV